MKQIIAPSLLLALLACSGEQHLSKTSGHYENMSKAEAEALVEALSPVAIAEHELTETVIISAELIMDTHVGADGYLRGQERADIAKAILDTGVKLIVVTNDSFEVETAAHINNLKSVVGEKIKDITFIPAYGDVIPTVWARDWGPIQALDKDGSPLLLDFNYYPSRPIDDFVPIVFEKKLADSPRISVPVYNEGGNFMSNTRAECIMSSRVSDANQEPEVFYLADDSLNPVYDVNGQLILVNRDNVGRKGTLYYNNDYEIKVRVDDEYLDDAQIAEYYMSYAGCEKVVILPRMPFEGTGHIDMWAKFLNDDEILINSISDQQIADIKNPTTLYATRILQRYLQDRAEDLAALGYKITEIPMPIPQHEYIEYNGQVYENFIIRSYTNSLIIQKEEGDLIENTALIPQYLKFHTYLPDANGNIAAAEIPYDDDAMLASYEAAVAEAYRNAGFKINFIPSDDLIAMGGAIHCVTMQLAKNPF